MDTEIHGLRVQTKHRFIDTEDAILILADELRSYLSDHDYKHRVDLSFTVYKKEAAPINTTDRRGAQVK